MNMLTVSLPDALKAFVDEQVAEHDFGNGSDYVTSLIQRELDRERLRRLVMEGANSPLSGVADDAYFEGLRERVRRGAGE